jgi:putative transposase
LRVWLATAQRDRMATRVRNKIADLHHRVIAFLTSSFDVIFLPTFQSQRIVDTGRRPFGSDIARSLMTWSHYQFRQRLERKVQGTPGCCVVDATEVNSTRTCSFCGTVNNNVGASKVFCCVNESCGAVAHRDGNAARNIFLFNVNQLPAGSVRLYSREQPCSRSREQP